MMNNIQEEEKKIISSNVIYSMLFIALSLICFNVIFGKKIKNTVSFYDNKYIVYEKNKNIVHEQQYIDNLYDNYAEKVRMSKAKRLQKFFDDHKNGKIGMLNTATRNKLAMKFKDSVIVGDSIAQQVQYMIFKNMHIVKAEKGVALPKMGNIIDEALAENPKNLIFLKGLNDAGYYRDVKDFIAYYEEVIDDIKSRVPGINIYICSVLPPSKELLESNGSLVTWDIQNRACKDMCERKKINFVDTLFLFEEDADMRNPDGMHFTIQYYDRWLQYLDIVVNY